jgi:hypothetical protein
MFEPVRELSSGAVGRVQAVRVLASWPEGTVVEITGKDGFRWVFMAANGPGPASVEHQVRAGSEVYTWTGHAALRKR